MTNTLRYNDCILSRTSRPLRTVTSTATQISFSLFSLFPPHSVFLVPPALWSRFHLSLALSRAFYRSLRYPLIPMSHGCHAMLQCWSHVSILYSCDTLPQPPFACCCDLPGCFPCVVYLAITPLYPLPTLRYILEVLRMYIFSRPRVGECIWR